MGKGAELCVGTGIFGNWPEVGGEMLEETINLESGPIRDANPLVPPHQPRPHCFPSPLLIGSGVSARQTSSPLNRGFTKTQVSWTLK